MSVARHADSLASGHNMLWPDESSATREESCDSCGGRLVVIGISHDRVSGAKREWECKDCGVSRWDALR